MKTSFFFLSSFILMFQQIVNHLPKNQNPIQGDWCLVNMGQINELNYGSIRFDNNGAITLSTLADTIYSYEYRVSDKTLLIFSDSKNDTCRSIILKLTSDSLVLSSLLEKKSKQTYYRCSKH